jgi:branched-chain amino acid transport system permease protein
MRGPAASASVVLVLGVAVVLPFAEQYAGTVFVLALCYAIVTAGMAVQIGFSQQVAFSQSVFMGAGAYGVAMLNTHLSMPSLLATPIVMLGSGLAALLLGSVVTRASGLALAVATLMLPLIATGYLSSAGYLGGSIGTPLTGNLWQGASTEAIAVGNGLITVVLLALVVFVSARILSSDIGLELYVLGADEQTAAAMGVRTPRRKLELFVLGSVLAALGGAVYAGTQLFVPASLVSPTAELALLMMLFVGGRRSVLGAVAGALAIQYLYGASNWVSVNILIVEGVLLTVVLLADPEGLAGIVSSLARRLRRPAPASPSPPRPAAPASYPGPRQAGDGLLLLCEKLGKDYGGLTVLDDVSLALPGRGLFGLCGPNGAGKSTLLGVIGGSVSPSRGQVLLDGEDVTALPPQLRFQRGVSRTFQAVHLIRGRSVLDNVAVACLSSHRSSIVRGIVRSRLPEARRSAAQALDYLGMAHLSGQDVSSLTLENQRMVELARAIAARPRLLLLDEPASGLSGPQRERLAEVLRAAGEMTCVLLVEHDLDLVARISQKIFVLARGQLVFDGGPEDFRSSGVVNSLLIGG